MAWEFQGRGLLHRHVVVGADTFVRRQAARCYHQKLRELAPRWGFGFTDAKISGRPSRESAAYLSSYFISGKGDKASIRETVRRADVPPHVVYVSRELTTATGITMRSLRRNRYLWVLRKRYGLDVAGAQAVADYIRNTGVNPLFVVADQNGLKIVRRTTEAESGLELVEVAA